MNQKMADGKRERRRHPRAITTFSANLTVGEQVYTTRVINLSMGGALLEFRRTDPVPAIAMGARLTVEIRCRGGAESFVSEGKTVLWNRVSGPEPLLAIQFDQVEGEAADVLEEMLAEALAELRGRGLPRRASLV